MTKVYSKQLVSKQDRNAQESRKLRLQLKSLTMAMAMTISDADKGLT